MDVRIATFLTLYETMNYHETARLCNMTQPTVTQHIKSLEAEFGCRFFVYDRKKLSKTKEAEIFASYARSAVFNRNKLCDWLQKPTIRNFRIGATKSIGGYMIRSITAAFLADPTRTAEITVDNTVHLLQMLDRNQIDFALIEGAFDRNKYASRLFRKEPLCGICAKDNPFAGKTVSLESLFAETLIQRESGSGTRGIIHELFSQFGYSETNFARVITVSEFSLLCGLVASGIGISFVYTAVAAHSPEISAFSVGEIPPVHEMNYVFLKDTVAEAMVSEYDKYAQK